MGYRLQGGMCMKTGVKIFLVLFVFSAACIFLLFRPADEKVYFDPGMTVRQFALQNDIKPGKLKAELGVPSARGRTTLNELGVDAAKAAAVFSHIKGGGFAKKMAGLQCCFAAAVFVALVLLYRNKMSTPEKYSLLTIALIGFGFALGKTYNPMVSMVRVFKGIAGVEGNLPAWLMVLTLFCLLAVIGTKAVCGWVCPFGALQEILFKLPFFRQWKRNRKIPFWGTNCIRLGLFGLFIASLCWNIFGLKEQGRSVYHAINPFNLFELSLGTFSVLLYITAALTLSLFFYRPHCYSVCPFGLLSWFLEKISIFRICIDRQKCTGCGACITACPGQAMRGLYEKASFPADCFSCGECLNACRFDALAYTSNTDALQETKNRIASDEMRPNQ